MFFDYLLIGVGIGYFDSVMLCLLVCCEDLDELCCYLGYVYNDLVEWLVI